MPDAYANLKSLIEFSSTQIELIFRHTGRIVSMYHAVNTKGETFIMTPPMDDKDLSVAIMKMWLKEHDVNFYVFIDEAWILDTRKTGEPIDDETLQRLNRTGLRDHPDRREIVMFQAENRRGEEQTAKRYILRPEHGKARLGPLEMDDMTRIKSSGRMVRLLQW